MQGTVLQAWGVLYLSAVKNNSPPHCVSVLSDAAENLWGSLDCGLFGFFQFNKALDFFDSSIQWWNQADSVCINVEKQNKNFSPHLLSPVSFCYVSKVPKDCV